MATKARESATLAVETYNRPHAPFRVFGFIVLMQIAWTSLLLATFHKRGIKPFYRTGAGKVFEKVDGEPKRWELAKLASEYFTEPNDATLANLDFFIKLRNKIEHRELPDLDIRISGECQALLFNLERIIETEFGSAFQDSRP